MSDGCSFPTPTSGTWQFSANGVAGSLVLTGDDQGNLNGSVDDTQAIRGFWDCVQSVTFLRIIDPTDPSTVQVFSGVLTKTVQIDFIVYTMTGTYQAFSGPGVSAQQNVFPWSAQMTHVL